jgi:hypothetical protein
MDKEKLELILKLHKEGNITTEEAIILMPAQQANQIHVEPLRVSDWPWGVSPQVDRVTFPQQVWHSTIEA